MVANIEAVETLIASCMNAQGFEYVPVDATSVREVMGSFGMRPGLSDEEYLAQFGFGITTEFDAAGLANLFGESNVRIYNDLAPADQVAYDRALLGENLDATFILTLKKTSHGRAGARGRQWKRPSRLSSCPVHTSTPSMCWCTPTRATSPRRSSGCSACAKRDLVTRGRTTPKTRLREQLTAITGGADPTTLTGPELDALTELQGEERAVAVVAHECEEEFLADVEDQIEEELTGE